MDGSTPLPLLKALIPKVPMIGKTALFHALGVSSTSKEWDLRTEVVVNVLRSFIDGKPQTVSKVQHISLKDPGIKGKIWVSKTTMPVPGEDDIRQALFKAIEAMKEPGEAPGGFKEPELLPVEAEWTGYRSGATPTSPELHISEAEKYKELMTEVTSEATVLYFHGGAYYLMDPSSHRPVCSRLAKLTKGRCYSVRYRLAPQNPFPAALLDALLSYMTLLYPPAGSFHTAVDPKHIVLSGDSAGGNLATVLLQLILELRRQEIKITFNGVVREVPLPAGAALNSSWMDVTQSTESCETNGKYDYLPPRSKIRPSTAFPKCAIWPANPPRKHLFAEDGLLCHPLVSPIAAKSWASSCPLWLVTGEELLTDEDKYVACKAAKQGIPVVFEQYKAMPHCFGMIFEHLPGSKRCYESWAGFIDKAVNDPGSIKTKGTRINARTLVEEPLDVEKLTDETEEFVLTRMKEAVSVLSGKHPDSLSKL